MAEKNTWIAGPHWRCSAVVVVPRLFVNGWRFHRRVSDEKLDFRGTHIGHNSIVRLWLSSSLLMS
jgi:hypothetical protein